MFGEQTFAQLRTGFRLLLQTYQYPNLSEGADRVVGQLRGDKEYPLSGVTCRVWRKVPESDARSVRSILTPFCQLGAGQCHPGIRDQVPEETISASRTEST